MTSYADRPWTKGPYRIRVVRLAAGGATREWQDVGGYVCPPFAARRTDGGGWSCDHMHSGASVGGFGSLAKAKDYARELVAESGGPEAWEAFTDPRDIPDDLREVIKRVARAWGQLVRAPRERAMIEQTTNFGGGT